MMNSRGTETAILAHYSRTVGHGIDWNMYEGAVYHAANERGTVTLCGYQSDAPGFMEGASDRGWDFLGNDDRYWVSCKHCLRILEGEQSCQRTSAQIRQSARRRDRRVKEAFDRLRDYLLDATMRYQPSCLTEQHERKTWRRLFAESAYELLRHTQYKGFQNFTDTDWSCVESGALSQMYAFLRC